MRLGTRDRMDDVTPGVKSPGNALDVAAFSGCIPAFIGYDDRYFLFIDLVVKIAELFLEFLELRLVFFICQFLVQRDIGEERAPLHREGVLEYLDCI